MILQAAIDLLGGQAVQLVGGRPSRQTVSLPRPVEVARRWVGDGFSTLHVVDLNAALGTGSNRIVIERLVAGVEVPVQVAGGIRSTAEVERWLQTGAARVVIGTRAVQQPEWAARLADRFPRQIVVAADVRDDTVLTHGWTNSSGKGVEAVLEELRDVPVASILVTDVAREGRQGGVDVELFADLAAATDHDVVAAGGITTIDDIRRLRAAGVAGAVLGTALYTGKLDVADLQEELR